MRARGRTADAVRRCGSVAAVVADAVGIAGTSLGVCALVMVLGEDVPSELTNGAGSLGVVGMGVALLRVNGFLRDLGGTVPHLACGRTVRHGIAERIVTRLGILLPGPTRDRYVEEWRGLTHDALHEPGAPWYRVVTETFQCLRAAVTLAVVLRTTPRAGDGRAGGHGRAGASRH